MLPDIQIELAKGIDPSELLDFYSRQQFALTTSREKLARMLDNSFCLVTARKDGQLIGFARGATDGVRGQLVECKLDTQWQGPGCVTKKDGRIEHDNYGIARQMAQKVIESLHQSGVERIDVTAYGTEVDFCEELGFRRAGGIVTLQMDMNSRVATQTLMMAGGTA